MARSFSFFAIAFSLAGCSADLGDTTTGLSACLDVCVSACIDETCAAECERSCGVGLCTSDEQCPLGTRCNTEPCYPSPACAAGQPCAAVCYGQCEPEIRTCGPLVCPPGTYGCNCACDNRACVPEGTFCAAVCR